MSLEPPIAFFSYSRDDSPFVLELAKDLRAAGAAVWLDQIDIRPGQHWDDAIEKALGHCPNLIVILSPASVESTNVMDEVSFAIDEKKSVIPVLYQTCKIPFRLRRLEYVDARTDYNLALTELLSMLGTERSAPLRAASAAAPQGAMPEPPPAPAPSRFQAPPAASAPVQVEAAPNRSSARYYWLAGAVAAVALAAALLLFSHKTSPPASQTYQADVSEPARPGRQTGSVREIDRFIKNFLDASEGPTPLGLRSFFDDEVSPYFGLKTATWDAIQTDKQRYFQHFRTVSFTQTGEPSIRKVNEGEIIVDYDLHYENVRSDGTPVEGNSHQTLDLVLKSGTWKIAGITEALQK